MNKTAIKNFAIWARVQLIEAAKQRAFEYGITEEAVDCRPSTVDNALLSKTETEQRKALISRIRAVGYNQVMEEAAYTWFNRFIALRFMEVNGYLPGKVRVFTDEAGTFKPEILKQAMTMELNGLDRNHVLELLDKQNNEELFKYLLITQCNALNAGLPYMFEKIANWTELLFPANLLRPDSVIGTMVSAIPEEDWTDQVQIIGWLYQYYNAELKDETFALLKKNVKITKERIPAATQLFTPDWIVRYMVENSLGRLAISSQLLAFSFNSEAERAAKEKEIADSYGWKYYLPEAEQSPDVRQKLTANSYQLTAQDPTTLRVLDPCMGSGHILVYAFDVLMQIYTSAGWSERDAAQSILENNLYGLDIDDRAGQLAYFAVMMKARKYSRRILNGEVKPNVLSIQDSNWMTDEFIEYVAAKDMHMKADLMLLRKTFMDAKENGSILNVPPMQYAVLFERIDIISRSYAEDLFQAQYRQLALDLLLPLVKQAQMMEQKYDVVVTNPPYMGSSGMSAKLDSFVKNNYPDSKSDLFAVFIERCSAFTKSGGYQAMITQHAWMFLSSFEKLRGKLLTMDTVNMAHLGARAFDEISGEVVQTVSFVMKNRYNDGYMSKFFRLINEQNQTSKEYAFLNCYHLYITTIEQFKSIPHNMFLYWLNKNQIQLFEEGQLEKYIEIKQGVATSDNNRFLRLWFEVNQSKIGFGMDRETAICSKMKWFPYNKGGTPIRWYGNQDYVVNYENNGAEMKAFHEELNKEHPGGRLKNPEYYFKEGFTWSTLSNTFAVRYCPQGFIFDTKGSMGFVNKDYSLDYFLALLNSTVGRYWMNTLAPTLDFNPISLRQVPIKLSQNNSWFQYEHECIMFSRCDWDSFETSWDFKKHPLV